MEQTPADIIKPPFRFNQIPAPGFTIKVLWSEQGPPCSYKFIGATEHKGMTHLFFGRNEAGVSLPQLYTATVGRTGLRRVPPRTTLPMPEAVITYHMDVFRRATIKDGIIWPEAREVAAPWRKTPHKGKMQIDREARQAALAPWLETMAGQVWPAQTLAKAMIDVCAAQGVRGSLGGFRKTIIKTSRAPATWGRHRVWFERVGDRGYRIHASPIPVTAL